MIDVLSQTADAATREHMSLLTELQQVRANLEAVQESLSLRSETLSTVTNELHLQVEAHARSVALCMIYAGSIHKYVYVH